MDPGTALGGLFAAGFARCVAAAAANGGLLASLFAAGLVGGLAHCAGMCGPFVLAQVAERQRALPAAGLSEMRRLAGAALLPYHLGRASTYIALGAAAGALASGAVRVTGFRWLSAALLFVAAALFLGYGVGRLGLRLVPGSSPGIPGDRLADLARPLFRAPTGPRGYALGAVLGLLPCGLLYGALAAAGGVADPVAGAFAMAAFSLGTVPALVAVAAAGEVAMRRWRAATRHLVPGLMLLNGAVLAVLAWRWLE